MSTTSLMTVLTVSKGPVPQSHAGAESMPIVNTAALFLLSITETLQLSHMRAVSNSSHQWALCIRQLRHSTGCSHIPPHTSCRSTPPGAAYCGAPTGYGILHREQLSRYALFTVLFMTTLMLSIPATHAFRSEIQANKVDNKQRRLQVAPDAHFQSPSEMRTVSYKPRSKSFIHFPVALRDEVYTTLLRCRQAPIEITEDPHWPSILLVAIILLARVILRLWVRWVFRRWAERKLLRSLLL